jgi:hypothetical protein
MWKEWEKRELYKDYAGICLSEDEYNNLVDNGIIPKSFNLYYVGCYKSKYAPDYDYDHRIVYFGSITNEICESGTKLFLENWRDENENDHTAAFFFDDFLVIIAEPRLNSKYTFDKAPDVLPVAIPICNIKSYQIDESYSWNMLTLKFTNGATYYAYLQWNYQYKEIRPVNFSLGINSRLLGDFSYHFEDKSSNFEKITFCLDLLKYKCCRDYSERIAAISSLFTDQNLIAQLQKIVYLDKKGFLEGILCYKGSVSDTDFPEVIEKLDEIQGILDQSKRTLKEKMMNVKLLHQNYQKRKPN